MGLFGDIVGAWGAYKQWKQGEENFALQKEQFEYEKGIQEKQWLREDSAYQRKVADLRAAGLNPVLAAGGSGSPTSSPIQVHAPQNESAQAFSHLGKFEGIQEALSLMQQKKNIAVSDAQEKLLKIQQEKTGHETTKAMWDASKSKNEALNWQSIRDADVNEKRARAAGIDLDNTIKEYDFNKAIEDGVASGAVQNGNSALEFTDAMKKALNIKGGNPLVDTLILLTSKLLDSGTVNQGLRMLKK